MRYAWTVAGDDPDLGQGDKHGIDGYFYPMADTLTTTTELQRAASWGGGRAIGIYYGHNWHPEFNAGQIAEFIKLEYRRVTKNSTVLKQLRVMYNEEDHNPAKVITVLEQVRLALPRVGLSWSPEGMQGGWMGPVLTPTRPEPSDFIKRLLKAKVRIVPQNFWGANGTIQGDYAADAILRDLIKRGIPESSVSLFWDGKTLDSYRNAQGYVFTMGRLPWLT